MKRRSAGLRILGASVLILASSSCEVLVSDGDYKVDPGAFAEGGTTGTAGASGGGSGASGATSGTHSPEGGSGASGMTGAAGASSGAGSGTTGTSGASGASGTGATGAAGAAGNAGMTGTSGMTGAAGMTGAETTGSSGTSGTSMPVDASVDQSAPDGGGDAGRDAGHETTVDAGHVVGDDAGTNICAAESGDTDCDTCQRTSCCTPLTACGTDCVNIFDCISNCTETTSTSPCGCLEEYPGGVSEYLAMNTCVQTNCDDECVVVVDNGDPCVVDDECEEFYCSSTAPHYGGNWCTDDGCASDYDCSSATTYSGNNSYGEPVSCVQDGRTSTCFPGCQSNADCAPFPGTTCQAATSVDGYSAMICELP